jgi:DNA-binding transcriptional LysR family regulator
MRRNQLSRVDFKLLLALQVLIEERNVTRAAERLHVTQPALSKTLQKLKELFNDPLFTRGSHGLIPTPKTEELALKLPPLLEQLQLLVEEQEFDPTRYRGRFRLALPQLIAQTMVPHLVERLSQRAPQLELEVTDLSANYLEELATGQRDFIIQRQLNFDPDYLCHTLGFGQALCVMRHDHPLSHKSRMSLEDYLSYPHVRVYFPGMNDNNAGLIDEVLQQQQLTRRVLLATTDLGSALETLIQSDCLMVGAMHYTNLKRFSGLLHAMPFPEDLPFPEISFALVQHRRSLNSRAHQWLKDQILDMAYEDPTTPKV